MRSVWIISGLCLILTTGCAYKKENGEWRPMNAEESAIHYTKGQLKNATSRCEFRTATNEYHDCMERYAEPHRHNLEMQTAATDDSRETLEPTGPFTIPPREAF